MSVPAHRLENRAAMLAGRIVQRRDALATQLQAPGDRPLFTDHKTMSEAVSWWRAHRNDKYGQEIINRWYAADPTAAMLRVQELDGVLSRAVERDQMYGTAVPPPEQGVTGGTG